MGPGEQPGALAEAPGEAGGGAEAEAERGLTSPPPVPPPPDPSPPPPARKRTVSFDDEAESDRAAAAAVDDLGKLEAVLGNGARPHSPMDSKNSMDSKRSFAVSESGSEASSSAAGSGTSGLSPHYDAAQDVILRLEFLRTAEIKAIIRTIRVTIVIALAILIVTLVFEITKPPNYYLQTNTVMVVNVSFASVLCAGLLICWLIFFYRVYRSNLSRKRWSHRRRRSATIAGIELTLQLINSICFIIPNAYVLHRECSWYDAPVLWAGFVRWTIWNTLFLQYWVQAHSSNPARGRWAKYVDRPDAAIMDAPLYCHWPKLGLWLVLEGVLIGITVVVKESPNNTVFDPTITDCRDQPWDCSFTPAATALLSVNVACLVTYFLLYVFFITRALHNLKFLPYNAMRMANLTTRLQIRLRSLGILFFVLCAVTYTFVKFSTCSSYVLSWFGYLPMQLVMSVTAICNAYMCMPKRPHQAGILQVWLQEFAWTESEQERKLSERMSSLCPDSPEAKALQREPMFCFETAIKCMFWSFLVYDYGEKRERAEGNSEEQQVDAALALWDLEHFEMFWEKSLDTKAVVGWNDNTVVIAFRGTASLANVKADLQVWRTRYPPDVGSPLLCTAPQVHQGFHACYTTNEFNHRLLSRIEHILYRCSMPKAGSKPRPVSVVVTGHSLGGALATLCAYDIQTRCPQMSSAFHVKCYTFGAPRIGNRAFAREYDHTVPDTWRLINNDDVVTKAGKFWFLYKRTGHKVLLNQLGDLLVRPNYVETAIRGVPGGASVRDHLLTSYQRSVVSVVAAQFGKKSFQSGREGALSLTQQKGMLHVLQTAGLSVREIRVLQERGWEAWRALRQSRRRSRSRKARGRPESAAIELAEEFAVAATGALGLDIGLGQRLSSDEVEAIEKAEAQGEAPPSPGATEAAAAAAAAAGGPDLEAGLPASAQQPQPQEQKRQEERDGVLVQTRMNCRRCCGRRSRTICALLGKQGGAAVAPEPANPLQDAPPPAKPPLQGNLSVIVEEGAPAGGPAVAGKAAARFKADSPSPPPSPGAFTPPSSPQPGGRRERKEPWWQSVATALGFASAPMPALSGSLSSVSLASSDSGESPSAMAASGTRGPDRGLPVFPLVLDWSKKTAEEVSGDAMAEYAERQRRQQEEANRRAAARAQAAANGAA